MALGKMWTEFNGYLDDDERLVYPEMYLENRHLYDGVRDIVYLIKDRSHPDASLEWIKESALGELLKNHDYDILAKQLIVRLRLPWTQVQKEWLVTQEELEEDRKYLEVIGTFLRVLRTDDPEEIPLFDILDFEANRHDYEVVEVQYLVTMRRSKADTARLLGIPPDNIHTYMQQ